MLLDDWIGRAAADGRDDAELARRYLESHAPADVGDFGSWSGLGTRAARSAVAALGSRVVEVEGGLRLRSGRRGSTAELVRLVPARAEVAR